MKDNNQSVTNELETGGKRRWRANCVTSLTARWHQPIGSDALLNTRWPCTKSKTFQLAASVVNVTLWSIEKSRREITPPQCSPLWQPPLTLSSHLHIQAPYIYPQPHSFSWFDVHTLIRRLCRWHDLSSWWSTSGCAAGSPLLPEHPSHMEGEFSWSCVLP